MIDYTCPHCGNRLAIPDEYAGKQGKCNKCQQGITVPEDLPVFEGKQVRTLGDEWKRSSKRTKIIVSLLFPVVIYLAYFSFTRDEYGQRITPEVEQRALGPGQERAKAYEVSQEHVREKIRAVMPGGVGFPRLSNITVNYIGPDPQTGEGECYKVKAYGENFSKQTDYQAVVTKQPNGQWTCRILSIN